MLRVRWRRCTLHYLILGFGALHVTAERVLAEMNNVELKFRHGMVGGGRGGNVSF